MNPSTNLSRILIKKFGRTKRNVLSLAYIDSKLIRVSWVTFLGNVKFSSNNNFPFTQHLLCMRVGVLTPLNQNKLLKLKNFFGGTPFLLFCTIYYFENLKQQLYSLKHKPLYTGSGWHSLKMRFQRRLYGIYSAFFLTCLVPCNCKLFLFSQNHL